MPRRDTVWIVSFLLLGVIGFTIFTRYYNRAFPVASLNFRLTRDQVYQKAEAYVRTLGYDTKSYRSAQIFSNAGLQQIFLERTLGLAEANRLARTWVSVWYWRIRWYKPLDKEELRVRIDPVGRIVGFEHRILESTPGAHLSQEAALTLAETYLTETQGFDLDDYERIEASDEERPQRLDHTFTYRKKDFTVGDDGHYRLQIVVQGDQIGSFTEYLKVPETFARSYTEIRSRAGLLANIASVFFAALGIVMLVVLMQNYRRGVLAWRATLFIGLVVAGANLISHINGYPIALFGYNTMQSGAAFWLSLVTAGIFASALIGGIICLVGTAGGVAAANLENWRNPFSQLRPNIRSHTFARAALIGYGLAFAQLGYVTLFYMLGNTYLGVWSPAEMSQYSNTYSTYLPWIYPLLTGLVAATLEEFFFRLLAISLLIRWTGKRWLAVLLPAVVWAFLHANYPQEPIYIRGLEISAVGIVFGIVFLRYGIWATLITHYVYDAFLGVYPMVHSDSLYFKISGILVVVALFIPALPAVFNALTGRAGEMSPDEEETPAIRNEPPESPPPAPPIPPAPDSARRAPNDYRVTRRELAITGLLALFGAGLWAGFGTHYFGDYATRLTVTRPEAERIADTFRNQLGFDLPGYRRTAWFSSDYGSDPFAYLVRNTDIARADTLAARETSAWRWNVRWYKPLEKEELTIAVDGQGQICGLAHPLPENRPGAMLDPAEAQKIAEAFLATYLHRDVTDTTRYKRLEARSQKREARIDHEFVWERTDIKVADGEFRIHATVQGDQIGAAGMRFKAPETFLRKLHERDAKDAVYNALSLLLTVATITLGVIYFLRAYRNNAVDWRQATFVALCFLAGYLIDKANDLPGFYRSYRTSEALATFLTGNVITGTMSMAFIFLLGLIIVALGESLFREQRPADMRPRDWLDVLRLKTGSAALWGQVIFLTLCWLLINKGLNVLSGHIYLTYLKSYLTTSNGAPPGINTYLPAISKLISGVDVLLMGPFGLFAVLFIWWKVLRKSWLLLVFFLLIIAVRDAVIPAHDLYQFAFLFAIQVLDWGIKLYLILRIFRFNLLFYAVSFWVAIYQTGLTLITDLGHPFYEINGIVLILFSLAPVALALLSWRKHRAGMRPPATGEAI